MERRPGQAQARSRQEVDAKALEKGRKEDALSVLRAQLDLTWKQCGQSNRCLHALICCGVELPLQEMPRGGQVGWLCLGEMVSS